MRLPEDFPVGLGDRLPVTDPGLGPWHRRTSGGEAITETSTPHPFPDIRPLILRLVLSPAIEPRLPLSGVLGRLSPVGQEA